MKALISARPRRGSCSEYFNSMSGAAMSSTTARLHFSPQNSVNQRPTIALLSLSLLMWSPLDVSHGDHRSIRCSGDRRTAIRQETNSASCAEIESVLARWHWSSPQKCARDGSLQEG